MRGERVERERESEGRERVERERESEGRQRVESGERKRE